MTCLGSSAQRFLENGWFLLLPTNAPATESDVQLWPVVTLNRSLTERWGAHFQTRLRFHEDVSRTGFAGATSR